MKSLLFSYINVFDNSFFTKFNKIRNLYSTNVDFEIEHNNESLVISLPKLFTNNGIFLTWTEIYYDGNAYQYMQEVY